MVAIDMCEKAPSRGSGYMELSQHVYFNISVLFIVDTTSILKSLLPAAYYFCLDDYLGDCIVAITVTAVVVFIFLFFYFVFSFCFFLDSWIRGYVPEAELQGTMTS